MTSNPNPHPHPHPAFFPYGLAVQKYGLVPLVLTEYFEVLRETLYAAACSIAGGMPSSVFTSVLASLSDNSFTSNVGLLVTPWTDTPAMHLFDIPPSDGEMTMSNAFDRLRWSVFEDISEILVEADPHQGNPELLPFEGHPIVKEAASSPPLQGIIFYIDDLYDPEEEEDKEDYPDPGPISIHRPDGGIVTVGDVIEQLSPYFIASKVVILRSKAAVTGTIFGPIDKELLENYIEVPFNGPESYISAHKTVLFDGFRGVMEPGENSVSVCLWADGVWGESLEDKWNRSAMPEVPVLKQFPPFEMRM